MDVSPIPVPDFTEVTVEDMLLPLDVILSMDDPLFDEDWVPDGQIRVILEHLEPNDTALIASGSVPPALQHANAFRRYWTSGPGGSKIKWSNNPNDNSDWKNCVRHLTKYIGPRAQGFCSLRKKEMTTNWGKHFESTGIPAGTKLPPAVQALNAGGLREESEFMRLATAKINAQYAKDRIQGLTASAFGQYAESVDPTRPPGSRFIIPLGLPLGLESGDNRIIAPDAEVSLRDLPIPLLWQINTAGGHDGSVVVGRIDSADLTANGVENIQGYFDNGVYGMEAERMVREGFLRGVSADMDKFEAQEVPLTVASEDDDDEDGPSVKIAKQQVVVNKTRIMAFTIVAKPAFQECQIFLAGTLPTDEDNQMIPDGIYVEDANPADAASLVAAGYIADSIPVAPPQEWFDDPTLHGPTPITVEDDGRIYGHIAVWDMTHIGMPNQIRPPHNFSNYRYFHTGVVRTAEGSDVTVGQLTLAGGHADLSFSAREAVRHYDDTASAVADVHAGEDRYGIWVSGSVRPGTTPEQIRVLRASAPSGDWRPIKGKHELVAVCQVNVPGFPVARTLVAGGAPMAIVAAGAHALALMRTDPISEMQSRLEKLEQFSASELNAKADPIKQKFAQVREERAAREAAILDTRAAELSMHVAEATEFAFIPTKTRHALAKKGLALPDGSFPIRNTDDLENAIHDVGRAKDPAAAKKHIIKRAKALGATGKIPDSWKTTSIIDQMSMSIEDGEDGLTEFTYIPVKTRHALARKGQALPDGSYPIRNVHDLHNAIRAIGRAKDPEAVKKHIIKRAHALGASRFIPADWQVKSLTAGAGDDLRARIEAAKQFSQNVSEPESVTELSVEEPASGKFSHALSSLRNSNNISGHNEINAQLSHLQRFENEGQSDSHQATIQAANLVNSLHGLDTKTLTPGDIKTVRAASRELSMIIANSDLPTDNPDETIHFSDLSPVIQQLSQTLLSQVEKKQGSKQAAKTTADWKSFASGESELDQAAISSELNKMLSSLE